MSFLSSPLPSNPLSTARTFLLLITAPTGFHNWSPVTSWAQLLITSINYLPSTPNERSTNRAERTDQLQIQVFWVIFVQWTNFKRVNEPGNRIRTQGPPQPGPNSTGSVGRILSNWKSCPGSEFEIMQKSFVFFRTGATIGKIIPHEITR